MKEKVLAAQESRIKAQRQAERKRALEAFERGGLTAPKKAFLKKQGAKWDKRKAKLDVQTRKYAASAERWKKVE